MSGDQAKQISNVVVYVVEIKHVAHLGYRPILGLRIITMNS